MIHDEISFSILHVVSLKPELDRRCSMRSNLGIHMQKLLDQ